MKTKLNDPTIDELRQAIENQHCWWCNSGPWVNLSVHTCKIHGISASEIRDMAHLTKEHRICSEEFSETIKKRPTNLVNLSKIRNYPRKKKILSKAGAEIHIQKLRDYRISKGGSK